MKPERVLRYKYAHCQGCGWRAEPREGETTAGLLAAHVKDCPYEIRDVMVPMWSVAWPYYWGVQRGEIAADWYGLEMAWRPAGTNDTSYPRFTTGDSEKQWFLFPVGGER